jgi:hypothetical protein
MAEQLRGTVVYRTKAAAVASAAGIHSKGSDGGVRTSSSGCASVLEDSPEQLHELRAFYRQCVANVFAAAAGAAVADVTSSPNQASAAMPTACAPTACLAAQDVRAVGSDAAAAAAAGSVATAWTHNRLLLENL